MAEFTHSAEGSHGRTRPRVKSTGVREDPRHKMNVGFLLNDTEPDPPFAPSSSMSQQPPNQQLRSPRAHMACVACRKRHIKCEATTNPRDNTCARCIRKGLQCEYIDTALEEAMHSPTASSSRRPRTSLGSAPSGNFGQPYGGGYAPQAADWPVAQSKTPYSSGQGAVYGGSAYQPTPGTSYGAYGPPQYPTTTANQYPSAYPGGYGYYPDQGQQQPQPTRP
uniref:C6 finger domain n=1 Tax=Mycena chlorophos TaxID=658473 RepID=A0ABQ0LNI3_MYCCL|nr:C6 finger domain [Mycena chlorophos]